MDTMENKPTKLAKPVRPENVPYPLVAFEEFYQTFKGKTVREITKTTEWQEIYCHYYDFEPIELDIIVGETTEQLEKLTLPQIREELKKCAKSFAYWCHRFVKILNILHGTVPFILYKYQKKVIKDYESKRFNMISKFRQGGLTTVAVLWGLWRSIFKKDQQIYVLSKTDREAKAAGDIASKAMDNMPYWMIDPEKSDLNKHEMKFRDVESKICFYTPAAARGKSATHIIIDEAAFIEGMDEHWKAMYPVIASGGSVAIISTVNGMGNWYEKTYHEAEAGKNFFNIIQLDYWEHPLYANPIWAEQTKANLGEDNWNQEVMRDFLNSGDTYISAKVLGHLDNYTRNNDPVRTAFTELSNHNTDGWKDGALWIWREPVEGHEYIIGADCAEGVGKSGDSSCFQVLDTGTLEQVAEFYSNKVAPHVFAQILHRIGLYYQSATIVVENNTVGGAVLNGLVNDLAYEVLYYENRKGLAPKAGLKIGPQNRSIVLEGMQHRLMNGTVRINSRRLVYELNTFIYSAQHRRAEARKGYHDDAIMALALAIHVRDERIRKIPLGAEAPQEMLQVFKSKTYKDIEQEITNGGVNHWITESEASNPFSMTSNGKPQLKRRYHEILSEFGW